jgi:hypothetical protein
MSFGVNLSTAYPTYGGLPWGQSRAPPGRRRARRAPGRRTTAFALSRVNALTRPSSSSTIGYDAADRVTSLAHAFTPTTGNETWTLGFTSGGQLASAASSNSAWDWAPTVASSVATVPD